MKAHADKGGDETEFQRLSAANGTWRDLRKSNGVLPLTLKKYALQAQARKAGSGWMSPGCKTQSKTCAVRRRI